MNNFDLKAKLKQNKEMLIRQTGLVLLDFVTIQISMMGALWIRCDFHFSEIDTMFIESLVSYWWINIICTIIVYGVFHMYTSLWRFASVVELVYTVGAVLVSTMAQVIGMKWMNLFVPRSYPFLYAFLLLVLSINSVFCMLGTPFIRLRKLRLSISSPKIAS